MAAPKIKTSEPLHLKYRPAALDEVIGQDAVVESIHRRLENPPHAWLFTGPSGVGKTTLARILGKAMNATLIEIDAATHSGVENMRTVTDHAQYRGIGEFPNKFIIVDEAHALSKATFQALLISIEEPPAHVYWALCTTEPDKIPATVKTRCAAYDLKPVEWEVIEAHLERIAEAEELTLADGICGVIARRAEGSVRQAIQWLAAADGVADKNKLNEILETAEGQTDAVDIAKMLVAGRGITWKGAVAKVQALMDARVSPEAVRIVVVNYVGAALLRTESEKEATRLLNVLSAFSSPFNASEKSAPLLLALGSVIFNG